MTNQAAAVAFNASAPESERTQALGELQQAHMPTASDLMPNETVRAIMTVAEAQYEDDLRRISTTMSCRSRPRLTALNSPA